MMVKYANDLFHLAEYGEELRESFERNGQNSEKLQHKNNTHEKQRF